MLLGGRCVAGNVVPGFSFLTVFRNQPETTVNHSLIHCVTRLFVPSFVIHLAVGRFPKLETGIVSAHKLAGLNVQRTLLVLKRTLLVLGRTLHILKSPVKSLDTNI